MDSENKKPGSPTVGAPSESGTGEILVTGSTEVSKAWTQWVPGPRPDFLYKLGSPRMTKIGFTACNCIIFILSGYNCSLMGSVSSTTSYQSVINLVSGTAHDNLVIGTINACYWVGVMVGALTAGWIADHIGRRKAIFSAALLGMIVIPIFTALQNLAWSLVLRLLNGVVTGALDTSTLTWSAETVDHKHRGRIIGLELACSAYGASFAYFSVYGLSKDTTESVIWRFPIALQLVMVIATLISIWFLPESPRWLVKVGLIGEARSVLHSVRDKKPDNESVESVDSITDVERTVLSIQAAIDAEQEFKASTGYYQMFFRRDKLSTARRTWTTLIMQFGCQFMIGGGLVAAYGMDIFQTGGWPVDTSALLTGFTLVTTATGGLFGATVIADRLGRRQTFLFFGLANAALLALLGVCARFVVKYSDSEPSLAKRFSIAVVALQLLWSAIFGVGWLWCAFTYPSELFPAKSRAMGNSMSVFGFASGSFVCNMVGSYIFEALGYKTFFLICGMAASISTGCWFFVPETLGKTLEDVDNLFDEVIEEH